jgi:hypothetical protein
VLEDQQTERAAKAQQRAVEGQGPTKGCRAIDKAVKISLLQAVEAHRVKRGQAPTFLRQTANRWRQGCQHYAPAALYPPGFFFKIPRTHFC